MLMFSLPYLVFSGRAGFRSLMSDVSGGKFLMKTYGSNVSQLSFKLPPVVVPAPAESKTKMILVYTYIPGVARLFCSRAKFN